MPLLIFSFLALTISYPEGNNPGRLPEKSLGSAYALLFVGRWVSLRM